MKKFVFFIVRYSKCAWKALRLMLVRVTKEQGNGTHPVVYMYYSQFSVWSWYCDRQSDDGNMVIMVLVSSKSPLLF